MNHVQKVPLLYLHQMTQKIKHHCTDEYYSKHCLIYHHFPLQVFFYFNNYSGRSKSNQKTLYRNNICSVFQIYTHFIEVKIFSFSKFPRFLSLLKHIRQTFFIVITRQLKFRIIAIKAQATKALRQIKIFLLR